MQEKEEFKNTYKEIEAWSRLKNSWVRRFESEKVFWAREKGFLSRENEKKWDLIHASAINIKCSSMDQIFYQDLSSIKSWQKWIYWGVVEDLSMAKLTSMDQKICREYIEQTKRKEIWLDGSKKLSRFYREQTQKSRWIKNLSKCYREDRKPNNFAWWIEDLSRFLSRLKKESSIEMNLSRICWEAIELEEKEF